MKINRKILFLLFFIHVTGCGSYTIKHEEVIVIKGSDTMLHLTRSLADTFSELNPTIKFQIFGDGTTSGIKELLAGRIDICTASRDLTPTEAKNLARYYGSIGMYYLIAKDALSVYVNLESPIENLSFYQLRKIFTGKYSNLSNLSVGKGEIKLAIRDAGSGTRKYLKDLILHNDEYCTSAAVFTTTEKIVEFVKENKNGIGFGGIGLSEGVKTISINGVKPSIKNAKNDSYPLTRYLHFFTSRSSSGNIKKFIDWVLSPEGQKIVKQEGFIPLWEINY